MFCYLFTFACPPKKKRSFFFKKDFTLKKWGAKNCIKSHLAAPYATVVVNTMGVHRFTCPKTVPKPKRVVETKQLGDDLGRRFY